VRAGREDNDEKRISIPKKKGKQDKTEKRKKKEDKRKE
jgi:hypothetical protein